LIVLGGNARLTPTAQVDGDVYALGGTIDAAPGARIGGRSVSYPTASSAWLTLDDVRREPFRSFFVGLTGVLAMLLTALFLSAFAGALVGVPLLVLVVLLAVVLKLWGMIAVFYALGDWTARRLFHRRVRPLTAATWGLLILGALKFVPWIGIWTWTAATLIGVGAALSTKFGRREPWFDLETA
jgi:hypothetical protein